MDTGILYKSEKKTDKNLTYLNYYIIPESISATYCDLKCYGIKIEKTTVYEGGGKVIEAKQMNNVFYRESDVKEFLTVAAERKTEPAGLKEFTEKYILESLDRAKQKI